MTDALLSEEDVREMLRERVGKRAQYEAAAEFGVTPGFLSMALNGKRPMTGRLGRLLGIKRVFAYEKTACNSSREG